MTFRRYEVADDDALNALKLRAFESGFERMRPDFWRWQYIDNPAGRASGVVAVAGAEMAAFIGIVPKRIKVAGRTLRGCQFVDYMVDPRMKGGYLGMGLARRCRAIAEQDGYVLGVGLANADSYPITVHRRVGMRHLLTPTLLMKPLRSFVPPLARLQSAAGSLVGRAATMGATLLSRCFPTPRPPRGIAIHAVSRFDARYDALWDRASGDSGVAFVRDAAYLQWRYLSHPVYAYQVFAAQRGDAVVGFVAVAAREMRGLRLGLLVDWLVDPALPRAAGWLFAAALEWARQARVDALAAALAPSMAAWSELRRAGYFSLPEQANPFTSELVIRRGLSPELDPRYADASRWFWTWGDSDVG